jgi:hypothetical protein
MEKDHNNNDKLIYENREEYIKLNEKEGIDVTEDFFNFANGIII